MQERLPNNIPGFKLEDMGPGVRGRKIPDEELKLNPAVVEELAQQAEAEGGKWFGKWVRDFYARQASHQGDPRKFFNFMADVGESILQLTGFREK